MKPHVRYLEGAMYGVIAGLVMAMVAMMATAALGMGLWAMPAMIGALLLGPAAAMSPGAGVILLGLMLHMMLSAMFGLVYAFVVNNVTRETLTTGIAFGIVLDLVNLYLIPIVLPTARILAGHEPAWLAAMTHLIFGLVLGALARRALAHVPKSA